MRSRLVLLVVTVACVAFIGGLLMDPIGHNPNELVSSGGVDSIRITDPVTGAGLFNANLDPNVTDVDPLTGAEAPEGTDVGFGSAMRAFVTTGMLNGDLRLGPPYPDRPLVGDPDDADYNPLPGWFYRQQGTGVTAQWIDGAVRFTIDAASTVSDQAWLEQLVPVVAKGRNGSHVFSGQIAESALAAFLIVNAQYVDADGADTGSFSSAWSMSDRTYSVAANGEAGMPADALWLRVQVGFTGGGGAATHDLQAAFVEERFRLGGAIYYAEWSTANKDITEDIAAASMYVVYGLNGSTRTLRSISSTNVRYGRVLWLYNADSTDSIIISHNNATPALVDRIFCPNSADLTVRPRSGVMLMYFEGQPGSGGRWRVMTQV